jgi:glucose/arabinose dehydrogenase
VPLRVALGTVLLALAVAAGAAGKSGQQFLKVRLVASGFESPVHVAIASSEPDRLYVVEQAGVIRVLVKGRLRREPFLDIRRLVLSGGEQGLLSMAFHPNYAKNRRFYVNYTDRRGGTRVVEYRSNGTRALTTTARQLLFVAQPYPNHNGGQLQFGPDGLLYVGMGDGGSGGDPENRAQNLSTLLGKLVRIDPATRRVAIAAYGLRNPWRFSFDRANGDLYIGDVGQGSWEEIDYLPRAAALGGGLINFGWNRYEGKETFDPNLPFEEQGRVVFPVAVYGHASGCSVTGGYVYRGSAVPAARGRYFYGDYCSGIIWSFRIADGKASGLRREAFRITAPSSFGEGVRGELYIVSLQLGRIYRLAR